MAIVVLLILSFHHLISCVVKKPHGKESSVTKHSLKRWSGEFNLPAAVLSGTVACWWTPISSTDVVTEVTVPTWVACPARQRSPVQPVTGITRALTYLLQVKLTGYEDKAPLHGLDQGTIAWPLLLAELWGQSVFNINRSRIHLSTAYLTEAARRFLWQIRKSSCQNVDSVTFGRGTTANSVRITSNGDISVEHICLQP